MTLTALLTGITVVMLYLAAVLPSAKLSVVAVAGLSSSIAVMQYGRMAGLLCYAASFLIALMIVPVKSIAILYGIFFGYYPVVKNKLESLPKISIEWLFKILIFNFVFVATVLLLKYGFLPNIGLDGIAVPLLWVAGNIAFVFYDIVFSKLIGFYCARFANRK